MPLEPPNADQCYARWYRGLDEAEVDAHLEALRSSPVLRRGSYQLPAGVHSDGDTFVLETGHEIMVKKPASPGAPGNVKAQRSIMIRNEAAAWELARLMGLGHLVPLTVLRSENGQEYSAQLIVGGVPDPADEHLERIDDQVLAEAALFDAVINQRDRLVRNWLVVEDENTTELLITLIDHGVCFDLVDAPSDGKEVGSFASRFSYSHLDVRAYLEPLIQGAGTSKLPELLSPEAYEAVIARAKQILGI